MLKMLRSLASKSQVYLMRRNQFDSQKLRAYFLSHHQIEVGLYSYGCFDQWRMPGPMRVGRFCSIASTVRSVLANHPMTAMTTHPAIYERQFGVVDHDMVRNTPLIIEDDVWVGHNAMILPGCKFIGRGAIVGAGAIVTHDVPAYAVVAGNPARKLRDRFPPNLIEAIEASNWWELSLADLRGLIEKREQMVFNPSVALVEDWLRERGFRRGNVDV
ncbi:CatB-related O-acetyltransferase [Phenylobacterium sp. Root700]|uniref:CatB-related O-acetyltransferase n=1 Tax=Phenylobacterium sp. Root700 TaxID=1736591 RepID=UPI000AFD027D|nr:CatB-related O-acetyltransferase [Phenylobacterium sp. Root700]